MIVVDTSALVAILRNEPRGPACLRVLTEDLTPLLSAATLVEARIVAVGRGMAEPMERLIAQANFEVVPVTEASAARTAAAYRRYGRGFHAAALNFGDCFSYELSKSRAAPLLYVGDDFAQTDLVSAI